MYQRKCNVQIDLLKQIKNNIQTETKQTTTTTTTTKTNKKKQGDKKDDN